MTAPRHIAVVIACHDRRDTTLACLEALAAAVSRSPGLSVTTTLVDDGSGDGTAEAVAGAFPRSHAPNVTVVKADGSLWWAGAMALGLNLSDPMADFQLWLNDDVVLRLDALTDLVAAHDQWRRQRMATDRRGPIVVGSTVDGDDHLTFGGARRRGFHPLKADRLPIAAFSQPCELINGNVVLAPRDAARRLAGIDPVFVGVQGMADTDYGLRARQLGIDVIVAPGAAGVCRRDRRPPPWRDPDQPVRERLRAIVGPRGRPWRAWLVFARRHCGPLWPLWWAAPLIKWAFGAPFPDRAPDRRVALVEGVIPNYRIGLMMRLAVSTDPRFIAHHGDGLPGLAASGCRVPPTVTAHHGRNFHWPRSFGGRIAWSAGVISALTGRFDVVCAGLHTHDISIWVLWLARRLFGRPKLMLSGHFGLFQAGPWPLGPIRRALRASLARGADAVLPYTEAGARSCRAAGIPAERIFISGNSVDVAQARAALAEITTAAADSPFSVAQRRQPGRSPDEPVFLFIGRLYPAKRVDAAIGAVRSLAARGVAVNLLVVGSGVDERRLKDLAADLPSVRFIPEEHDPPTLAALFRLSLAVICPGAVGLVAAHAAAHGAPLIASRNGGGHGPEFAYLKDDVNGLLTDDPDSDQLAAAMARLINDPSLAARLRRGAWETGDGLSLERAAAAYIAAARHAMGSGASASAQPPPPERGGA